MTKRSDREESFSWACANGDDPADAYRENFKTGRMKPETIARKANELLDAPHMVKKYERHKMDAVFVQEHQERQARLVTRPMVKIKSQDGKAAAVCADHISDKVFDAASARAFGTEDEAFSKMLGLQVVNLTPSSGEVDMVTINGILSALAGIAPRDEVEAMLAAQMVAVHLASVEASRRAFIEGQSFEGRNMNLKHAGQLMRTYTQQMETLKRYRQKAQQTVRVERVYVNEGGQAIVGDVHHTGGGAEQKNGEQPHAITHAPGETLRSENSKMDTVPVPGDA